MKSEQTGIAEELNSLELLLVLEWRQLGHLAI